jgi:hypothetical protein
MFRANQSCIGADVFSDVTTLLPVRKGGMSSASGRNERAVAAGFHAVRPPSM